MLSLGWKPRISLGDSVDQPEVGARKERAGSGQKAVQVLEDLFVPSAG